MAPHKQPPESLVADPGIWFGISVGLVIGTFLVAGLVGLGASTTAILVIGVGGLAAARLPGLIALALGTVAWAFYTGFTENSFGELTFANGDLVRLVTFAVATATLAALVRPLPLKEPRHG